MTSTLRRPSLAHAVALHEAGQTEAAVAAGAGLGRGRRARRLAADAADDRHGAARHGPVGGRPALAGACRSACARRQHAGACAGRSAAPHSTARLPRARGVRSAARAHPAVLLAARIRHLRLCDRRGRRRLPGQLHWPGRQCLERGPAWGDHAGRPVRAHPRQHRCRRCRRPAGGLAWQLGRAAASAGARGAGSGGQAARLVLPPLYPPEPATSVCANWPTPTPTT